MCMCVTMVNSTTSQTYWERNCQKLLSHFFFCHLEPTCQNMHPAENGVVLCEASCVDANIFVTVEACRVPTVLRVLVVVVSSAFFDFLADVL